MIGIKCIAEVTARDVREVLERIRESNRPIIANDTLMYMKQRFRHAIKLDLTLNNPAAAFTVDDARGVESSKDRMLSKEEIHRWPLSLYKQGHNMVLRPKPVFTFTSGKRKNRC